MRVQKDGLVQVLHRQTPVLTCGYRFWGSAWRWAGAEFRRLRTKTGETAIVGSVPDLGLTVSGGITCPAPNILQFSYYIESERELAGIIGGGIEFSLARNSPTFEKPAPPPTLLPTDRGWSWEAAPGQAISVIFSAPQPSVHFEGDGKRVIRAMMIGETLPEGARLVSMQVVIPDNGTVVPAPYDRYAPVDHDTWYADALPYDTAPVDLRYLNAPPAGRHGFLTVDGADLVFEDGTPVRFLGGNLAAYAVFDTDEHIEAQAKRIAQLGFNLMRIHHHDSYWVEPNIFGKGYPDTQQMSKSSLDRIDYWIKCLRDEGVYVWLDLHVQRGLTDGDRETEHGTIDGFEELARRRGSIKGFCYYDETLQALMKDFNRQYLTHVNPYTGLAYKDDPAIAAMLVTNENDLTCHLGHLMLPDKNNPVHNALFEHAVDTFCERTGLPRAQSWQTWIWGPSKIFLNDQEHRFNTAMLGHLRGEVGVRVPLATTSLWGNMGVVSLPALTDGDLIDAHSYGEAEALSVNPRYAPNYVAWIADAQAEGKPVSVSEWNVPYPTADRFTAPLYVAAVASLQGWDAPMIYAYSQSPLKKPGGIAQWDTFADPALAGLMPAAAVAFREGHIDAANRHYVLPLSENQVYGQKTDPTSSTTLRTLPETSAFAIRLPDLQELEWDGKSVGSREGVQPVELDRDFSEPGAHALVSDTGQIRRDWAAGILTIDTPRTQSASGWLGGTTVGLSAATFSLDTPKATAVLTSLDGSPIPESGQILLTTVAQAISGRNGVTSLSEPVTGKIAIRARDGLKLYPLAGDGAPGEALPCPHKDGVCQVELDGSEQTHWFLLK